MTFPRSTVNSNLGITPEPRRHVLSTVNSTSGLYAGAQKTFYKAPGKPNSFVFRANVKLKQGSRPGAMLQPQAMGGR